MDVSTYELHMTHLRHKNARIQARLRLLHSRTTDRDHVYHHQRRTLSAQARAIRMQMLRLQRMRCPNSRGMDQLNAIDNHPNINDTLLSEIPTPLGGQIQSSNLRGQRQSTNLTIDNHPNINGQRQSNNLRGQHQSTNRTRRWGFGRRTARCPFCKARMWLEERVYGSSKINPRFSLCCGSGQVKLPLLPPSTPYLGSLLRNPRFRDNIRAYNSSLAFTSMGCKVDHSVNDGGGPYVFKLNGTTCHRIGSLLPMPGDTPKFAQLYIYDTCNEASNRVRALGNSESSSLDPMVLQRLQNMLDEVNPYVSVFRNARNMLNDQVQPKDLRIRLINAREGRQYNMPTGDEVAALMVGDGNEEVGSRDIVLETLDGRLKRIFETHPSYMPLQYPLLFPYGTDGWTDGVSKEASTSSSRTNISMRQHYAFRMQDRDDEGDTLVDGGRLYQQYDVDAFATTDQSRTNWYRHNQGRLRADLYHGLQDAATVGDVDAAAVGRRYILPSSFTGGPRNIVQHYQDAMAVVRVFGPPDWFVTFTCNPRWSEIDDELLPGRTASDRPDIVSRVFHIKLKEFLNDFNKKDYFGRTNASLHVVEFQKRGLPHAHALFTMCPEDKPMCVEDIDKYISAELPDKDTDPDAFEVISRNNIHGPCGPSCLVDGKCSKGYPKRFCMETTIDSYGFVEYRRRPGPPVFINGRWVDNRDVVPYNLNLSVKYNAHINVERVAIRTMIKYLYKYVYKGHDRATFVIEDNSADNPDGNQQLRQVDEIQQFLDGRYVSAPEACWRLFDFRLQRQNPSTILLQFHLPGQQFVVFNNDDNLHSVLDRPDLQKTMLTMWFEANKEYPEARQHTYQEFPRYFVWNTQLKKWTPRVRQPSIGRLPYVHPNSGERYYLRLLLIKMHGATSFEDLRTIRGTVHPTFRSACQSLGLLDDDNEWHEALREAATWATGAQLRSMFCSILMFGLVGNPRELWEKHWSSLTDDLERAVQRKNRNRALRLTSTQLQHMGLLEINHVLNKSGKSLADFPNMPRPDVQVARDASNRLLRDELDYDPVEEANKFDSLARGLNSDQYRAFSNIMTSHLNNTGGIFFINGSGGTGKTYLWNTLISKFRSERKIVLSVASSGIAALLLPGGKTAHSTFKIPFDPKPHSVCNFTKDSDRAELMRKASLIIWDEAPMTNRLAFEAVSRHLQDICDDDRPFGGKLIVLGGDFQQTLPVIPNEGREAIVASTLHRASFWSQCRILHLRINMRLSRGVPSPELDAFAKWINQIGEGSLPGRAISEGREPDWIEIPLNLLIVNDDNGLQNLANFVYPDLSTRYIDPHYLKERAILAPTNADVDDLNNKILSELPGEMNTYFSSDTMGYNGDGGFLEGMEPAEVLNRLDVSGLPNHALHLKVGAPVIMLRNLDQSIGLCNGTRLLITRMGEKVLEAQVITGPRAGDTVVIPRIDMTPSNRNIDLDIRRRQFPLKLAFAMTINKSQGQTLNTVGIYLPQPVFTHGQLYVAVSRVTSPSGLRLLIHRRHDVNENETKNIVFREVLTM